MTLNAPILTAELQRVVCEQRLNDVVASLKFLFPGGGRFAAADSVAREHHVLGSKSELKLGRSSPMGRPFLTDTNCQGIACAKSAAFSG